MSELIVMRKELLEIKLNELIIDKVSVQSITLLPGQIGGLHIHPCPVTGYIVKGRAIMEIEGEEPVILSTGDAFYEPQLRIRQFGNHSLSENLVFIAVYLLYGDQEKITML